MVTQNFILIKYKVYDIWLFKNDLNRWIWTIQNKSVKPHDLNLTEPNVLFSIQLDCHLVLDLK